MPIDPSKALGAEMGEGTYEWDKDQVILYHLGVGAGVPTRRLFDDISAEVIYDGERQQPCPGGDADVKPCHCYSHN